MIAEIGATGAPAHLPHPLRRSSGTASEPGASGRSVALLVLARASGVAQEHVVRGPLAELTFTGAAASVRTTCTTCATCPTVAPSAARASRAARRCWGRGSTTTARSAPTRPSIDPRRQEYLLQVDGRLAGCCAMMCRCWSSAGPTSKRGSIWTPSSTPSPRPWPIDDATIADALVVVESRAAASAPHPGGSSDLREPLRAGISTNDVAELGEIVSGAQPGRTDPDQITLYKSVGVAVQDAAAVALVLAAGGGCNVDM
jgi:Ornithine cyclodeaminase/mu-crystallin family